MRLINQAELAVVSGGGVDDPMDGNADIAVGQGGVDFGNFGTFDAGGAHTRGQNSWGESVDGGVEFYNSVVANAALDAANYESCMRQNSKPSNGVRFAGALTGVAVGATVGILTENPAWGIAAGKATYDELTALGVSAQQSNCR